MTNNNMSKREIEARIACLREAQSYTDDNDFYYELDEKIKFFTEALARTKK